MCSLKFVAVAVILYAHVAQTIAPPRVVSLPVGRRNKTFDLSRRDTFSASLHSNRVEYLVKVLIGTPPQTVKLSLDTGSSDTWVFESNACSRSKLGSCLGHSYDLTQSNSSSLKPGLGPFSASYMDGANAQGLYFTDQLSINGMTVDNLILGLADSWSGPIKEGILGVGMPQLEARVQRQYKRPYKNFPRQLVSQGLISSNTFSLNLGDLTASTGTILFGGYDTEKFSGDLVMLAMENDPRGVIPTRFTVSLSGFRFSSKDKTPIIDGSALFYPFVLDSGSTLSYFPRDLFEPIRRQFNLRCNYSKVYCLVPCNMKSKFRNTTFDFIFGSKANVVISVPTREMILPFENGETEICMFGIIDHGHDKEFYVLGQNFLRSAYVFHDLDNFAIGLAHAKLNPNSSNVIEYSASATLPRIIPLENPARGRDNSDGSEKEHELDGTGGSPGSKIGTIVGASIAGAGVLAIVAGLLYICL